MPGSIAYCRSARRHRVPSANGCPIKPPSFASPHLSSSRNAAPVGASFRPVLLSVPAFRRTERRPVRVLGTQPRPRFWNRRLLFSARDRFWNQSLTRSRSHRIPSARPRAHELSSGARHKPGPTEKATPDANGVRKYPPNRVVSQSNSYFQINSNSV